MSDDQTARHIARIHAASFTHPRPWTEAEFRSLLSSPTVFLLLHEGGFLIGRNVADETELLTLAVTPCARRKGAGANLLEQFHKRAIALGATSAFLEVAAGNAPAKALYRRAGWHVCGRRRDYYGAGTDAVMMSRHLTD